MQKDQVPETFGVFRPVNHVVIALPSAEAADAAASALRQAGFADGDMARYTPEEMLFQAQREIAAANPVAAVGQDLNLVKVQRELAARGHSFLVVPARGDEAVQAVTRIAQAHGATRAQRYGRLLVEELIEVGEGLAQVAESPDRGLDAQTRSGREGPGQP